MHAKAWLLLALAPVLLFLARFTAAAAIPDYFVQDNRLYLWAWGIGTVTFGVWQLAWRSTSFKEARAFLLTAILLATSAVSALYAYGAIMSWRGAEASQPERFFEIPENVGTGRNRKTVLIYQRGDGTLLMGGRRAPIAYEESCVSAQRLAGEYGFTWVRVIERQKRPGRSDLHWQTRQEDCFSNLPLSSLPR